MRSNVEEQLLKLLFQGEVISKTMTNLLLPARTFSGDGYEVMSSSSMLSEGYSIAQDQLRANIQKILKEGS